MPSDDARVEGAQDHAQLLDAAPDAMLVLSTETKIQLANVQTEKLFGYPREELIGKPLELLIPDRFRGIHADHVRRYAANPTTRTMGSGLELHGRRRDGTDVPVEVSLSPVHWGGALSICAAIRDITDRRLMEASAKLAADRLGERRRDDRRRLRSLRRERPSGPLQQCLPRAPRGGHRSAHGKVVRRAARRLDSRSLVCKRRRARSLSRRSHGGASGSEGGLRRRHARWPQPARDGPAHR